MKKFQEFRIGLPGYARIVAAMPGTVPQIAERTGMSQLGVRRIVRELRSLGAIGEKEKTKGKPRSSPVSVWAVGDYPSNKAGTCARPRAHVIAFVKLLEEIQSPSSITDIVESVGIAHATARRVIKSLRLGGVCHIGAWQVQVSGPRVPMYRFGPGKDAKKPPPQPKAEIQRRMRAKQATDGGQLQRLWHQMAANVERQAA